MRCDWLRTLWLIGLTLALLMGCSNQAADDKEAQRTIPSPISRPTESAVPRATATHTPVAPTVTAPPPTASPVPTKEAVAGTLPAAPAQILIPRLGVEAQIEAVGQEATGAMAAPEAVEQVAWFAPGTRPGAMGNAVLSGHLDDYKQDPAVFWRLHELVAGDEVIVVDTEGSRYRFEVLGQELYHHEQAPLERIFGYTIQHNLNLITCNGTWDANALNYDRRLVVYTRLIEE